MTKENEIQGGPLKGEGGWTIVEILIIVTVLLILTGGVAFQVFKLQGKAETAQQTTQLSDLNKAITFFYGDNKRHPKSFDEMVAQKLLASAPDPTEWSMSCVTGGPLSIVAVARENVAAVEDKFRKQCESVSSDPATTKVTCILMSSAYCP